MTKDSWLERSDELYAVCLKLFPASYRCEYGALMRQFFRDQYRTARQRKHPLALIHLWVSTLADIGVNAPHQHFLEWRQTLMDTKQAEFLVRFHVAELVCGLLAMAVSFISFGFGWVAFFVTTALAVTLGTILATLLDNKWKKELANRQ